MEGLLLLKKDRKLFKTKNITDNEIIEIIDNLKEIKQKLDYAEQSLNYVNDNTLIDSIIYEILSLKSRYDYYLKLSKKKEIVINYANSLEKFSAS